MSLDSPDLARELWPLLSSIRGSSHRDSFGALVGSLLAEHHAAESGLQLPSLVVGELQEMERLLPPERSEEARDQIRSLALDPDGTRTAWLWFLDHSNRDGGLGGEVVSSLSVERLAVAALVSDDMALPDQPLIWSPCSGSGRAVSAVGRTLSARGLSPQLLMWDVNPSALVMSSVSAFLSDLPAIVVRRNCLTWDPRVSPVEAHLAVADHPMGMPWDSVSGEVSALHAQGAYPWGLPSKRDATWLFQQVVVGGLSRSGRGVTFTSRGPLWANDSNSIRQAALEVDQLRSIALLPSGTSSASSIERAAVLWEGSKHKPRSNRITIVNLKELFESAPEKSNSPKVLQEVAIEEFIKAISDHRPTRISRTLSPEDFTFNNVETSYLLLEEGGSTAVSTHLVPMKRSIDEWLRVRYGDSHNVSALITRQNVVNLTGDQIFSSNESIASTQGSIRLPCVISALRTNTTRKHVASALHQFGRERESPWLVVRGEKISLEDDAPECSEGTETSQGSNQPWHFAFQVDTRMDPQFLQAYLKFGPGRIDFRRRGLVLSRAQGVGQILTKLDDIFVPFPDLVKQSTVVGALNKLRMVTSQLDADHESVWDDTQSNGDLMIRIDGYLGDDDMKARLRTWPNPIASAAWMVVTSEIVPESQEKALVRFWEAVSGFHATLLLSAIRGIPDLELPILNDIRSGISKTGHLNLREASMGSFSLIATTCGNQVRSRIQSALASAGKEGRNPDLEQIESAFGGLRWELIERLVAKDLARLFERLRPLRTSGAHGGAESRSQLQDRVDDMKDLIREWDALTRSIWPEFELVRGGPSERLENHYRQEVEFAIGNDYPFSRGKVETAEAMKSGTLYMYVPRNHYFMEISAPLFEFMEIPEEAKLACYYFNRLRGDDLDLKSFVYPAALTRSVNSPLIGRTVHWLVGDK